MAINTKFEITGMKETLQVFEDLANDIGDRKATSKVLIPAVREAMKPVLNLAKSLAPQDTGLLQKNLYISAKRPVSKDKKSKYIHQNDVAIATVSTKPIPKKLKKEYKTVSSTMTKKQFFQSKGYAYDARAIAMEFGTKNSAGKPFLRPALESQASLVSNRLGQIIKDKIEKYRSKSK